MPRPPRDDGREAFNQDHSGKGPPAKSDRASSIEMSKTDMASFRWSGGRAEDKRHLREGQAGSQEGCLHLGVL